MADQRAIERLAANQHGVFSATQLREAGFNRHAVQRKLASSRWVQLDYRVFGVASAPSTWERQMWVAILSRPTASVGGRSAAYMHGLRGFAQGRPVIVVPGSSNARSEVARIIRAEHYPELKTVNVAGFPVTSVAETIVCLASELGPGHLESVFDDAMLAHKLDLHDVGAILEREIGRRRRGIVRVRNLFEEKGEDAPTLDASYLEGMLEQLINRGPLPVWDREHPVLLSGRRSRVDLFIPEWQLVVEVDGRSWHARTDAFELDRERDNQLASRGIQVLRFTFRMLKEDPDACFEIILATGHARSVGTEVERA